MSCGAGPINVKSCVNWEKSFQDSMESNLKNDETNAQLNLERQIGKLKNNLNDMWCLDKDGFYKKPVDEFCRVAKKFQTDGQITNKTTNQAIDKFCK